jgi:hypothetical protein
MMLAKYSASRRAADEAALTALGGISGTRMRRQASTTPPLLRNHRASARLLSAITDGVNHHRWRPPIGPHGRDGCGLNCARPGWDFTSEREDSRSERPRLEAAQHGSWPATCHHPPIATRLDRFRCYHGAAHTAYPPLDRRFPGEDRGAVAKEVET